MITQTQLDLDINICSSELDACVNEFFILLTRDELSALQMSELNLKMDNLRVAIRMLLLEKYGRK